MTGDKSLLKDYVKMKGPIISFGDTSKGFTLGYGTVASGNVSFEDVALVEEKESGEIVLQGVRK